MTICRPHLRVLDRVCIASAVAALLASGCSAYRAVNEPLKHWDLNYGYRAKEVLQERPLGDIALVLAFSGGGTRAAALSYGVLQELRDTRITVNGQERRLLDEVDLITSVSGGSFTSAYYGLFGDRIFVDYEQRFLRRNIQQQLIWEMFNPLNWFRLFGTFFDRTELAVKLYDDEIFDQSTFADLQAAAGPLIEINAADLAAGNRFTFFQPQFDIICSDLTPFKVARAVAASSAVPGVFAAITLRNYAGTCGFVPPPWLQEALANRKEPLRRYRVAKSIEEYMDGHPKYLHLVDGGVADNLGLRGPLDNVILVGGLRARFDQLAIRPNYIAVIVVNAETHPDPPFAASAVAPSLLVMLDAVSSIQIYSYNFETLELMHESLKSWAKELPPGPNGQPVEVFMPEIAFEAIQDPKEREYMNHVGTSFSLPNETIDRLIATGHSLLRESPDYQRLLSALNGRVVTPEGGR